MPVLECQAIGDDGDTSPGAYPKASQVWCKLVGIGRWEITSELRTEPSVP